MIKQIHKLLLLITATFFAANVHAHDVEIDGIYYNLNTTDKTASVTFKGSNYNEHQNRYAGHVTIPASITYNGDVYPVTKIGNYAFFYCSGLTSITIPASVTSIESYACSCSGLTSITIPASVTTIEEGTFYYCSGLTSITVPPSVTSLETEAFAYCSGLTSITIPSSVTNIGIRAFGFCSELISINVSSDNPAYSSDNGVLYSKDKTNLSIYPAGKTGSFTIPSSVTNIGNDAFCGCTGLTSISIPSSVTNIGNAAFYGCTGLTSISIPSSVTTIERFAFYGCTGLISISIPSSVTSIGNSAFSGCCGLNSISIPSSVTCIEDHTFSRCSGLTSINIPSSVTNIGNNAFSDCSRLTSVTIPSSVTSIGPYAFWNCSELTSVTIPSSMTTIGNNAFWKCDNLHRINIEDIAAWCNIEFHNSLSNPLGNGASLYLNGSEIIDLAIPPSVTEIKQHAFHGYSGLAAVTIPNSVTRIGTYAFSGCSELTSLTIPSSVTHIDNYAFYRCTLKPLILYTKLKSYSCFKGLDPSSVIYAYGSEINAISNNWEGTIVDIEKPYAFSKPDTYLCKVSFNIATNDLIPATLLSVRIGNNNTPYKEIVPDENGIYTVTGLDFNTSYNIKITYQTENGETGSITKEVKTKNASLYQYISTTQATATININASSDESCSPTIRYDFNGKSYNCTENKIVFSDLIPGKNYPITIYADYNDKILRNSTSFTTESLKPTITLQESSPTSISVKGSYTVKDAHVTETGFEGYDTDNTLTLTGLKPSTPYTINYYVKTEEGSNEIASQTFTTSDLELTTLQPRCVSSSCAIVAATTNISEEEMNVGFQWKKYDAPSSLKPNEGYAAIYGGQLEGYIRNLQSTSYYNVRAFYKSAEGDYFYGDWITFDPSDFSYFEPTVHTYAAAEVTHNSARMKGYILAGTEAIEEQGFEYWSTSTSSASARRVKAATTASDNVQTVFATGQVMTAELRDLLPTTTYCCRAFVKTSSGITYGEEQTFTTQGNPTGIGFVSPDTQTAPTVEGYYDLNGRKFEAPQRGINIIRYSNGKTRKIVVR